MATNPFQFNTQFEDGGFDADSGGQSELTPAQPQTKPAPSADVINKLTQQILSRGTANWSGEGLGSAQANAADMAKILAGIGITDVNQFGKFTQSGIPEEVRPDGRGGFVDQRGKSVNPSLVQEQTQSGEAGEFTSYTAPVGTQEVFGNKVTKQAVPETYGERQTGNFFGGTYSGKGNTGYGVQFDPQGNPIFFTQGASSADVAGNPVVALALAVVLPGVGVAIGETLNAAGLVSTASANAVGTALAKVSVSVAMGQPLDAAIKDAAISSIVQTGSVDAAKEIVAAGTDPKIANAIASVGGSIVQTAARGGDASDILTNAVAAAGASSLISMDVSPTIAKAIGVAVSGGTAEQVIKSLASSGGESKDVKNAIANTLLPSEPPEAPAVTPEVTPPAAATPTPTPEAPPTPAPAPTAEAPLPTVEVTAPTPPASVDQPILDLIKKEATPPTAPTPAAEVLVPAPTPEQPAPPAPAEEVKVTAPAEKTAEQQILDLIKPKEPEPAPAPAPELAPALAEVAPTPVPETPAPAQLVEEVKVSAPAEKTPDQAIIDLITPKAPEVVPEPVPVVEPTPAPPVVPETPAAPAPAPVEEVKVTEPAEKTPDQAIIDLITPKAPAAAEPAPAPAPDPTPPAPTAPVEEVKVTEKKEEPPVIVDTSAPPLITPTPSVAETLSPTVAPTPELEVTAPRPTVSPEDQPIIDLITPQQPPAVPELEVTAPREEEVKVTGKRDEVPIIDTTTPPVVPEEMVVTAPRDEEVKVTAKKEDVPIIDTVPEMTITDSKIPEMTITAPKEPAIIDTIPEIEITDKKTPEMVITAPKEPTIIDTTAPDLVDPPAEEPPPEEPYKPQITIFGGVPGKRRTLPQTLQAPFYPSAGLTQALTAQRGAGEIEGDPSGKPRKNVWNEASLRLKDALGL